MSLQMPKIVPELLGLDGPREPAVVGQLTYCRGEPLIDDIPGRAARVQGDSHQKLS